MLFSKKSTHNMPRYSMKTFNWVKNKISVGQVIWLDIAHVWQNFHWQSYSSEEYEVLEISEKAISLRMAHHHTLYILTPQDLNSAFAIFNNEKTLPCKK